MATTKRTAKHGTSAYIKGRQIEVQSDNPRDLAYGVRAVRCHDELVARATALLEKIDTITSYQFSRSEEKEEREALRAILAKATTGE